MGCFSKDEDAFDITKGGIVTKRSCTDPLCAISYILFVIVWLGMAITAFKNGDPDIMIYVSFAE